MLSSKKAVPKFCSIPFLSSRLHPAIRVVAGIAILLSLGSGCKRFHPQKTEVVYVVSRQMYLHDRVAAVSNRVGEVANGQALEVLEHGRRFLKVKTQKNEIGWIVQNAVIDADEYAQFTQLAEQHKNDPVIANAVVRDDIYLHASPGRNTLKFFLLPENAKVQLLVRASVPKNAPGQRPARKPVAPAAPPSPSKAGASTGQAAKAGPTKISEPVSKANSGSMQPIPAEPPVMEDWWLVRDAKGRAGWLLAGRVDVEVPDSVGQYAEGQRIVGAYVFTTIHDDNSDLPNHEVPEYVMLLEPPKSGLPYDFDQVRVFTWSVKRHRYETAFRLRPIQGFLPINISRVPGPGPGGTVPAFGIKIAADQNVVIDPDTGITKPASLRTINYEMIDTVVKRIGPDLNPITAMHGSDEKKKAAKAAKKPAKHKGK